VSRTCRVAVVGAGPYALSTAAFLGRAGIEARVFGEVMGFWHTMPSGMLLRSYRKQSSIADPKRALSLDAYEARTGKKLGTPVSLTEFIDYGLWFQQQARVEVDPRRVSGVASNGAGFGLLLSDGEMLDAANVVVAAGIGAFPWKPSPFDALDTPLVSHSSDHTGYAGFRNSRVLVIGAGQSALETAALLQEAGASTEILVRRPALRFLHGENLNERNGLLSHLLYPEWSVGPPGVNLLVGLPTLYRRLPTRLAEPLAYRAIRPAGSDRLQPKLEHVRVSTGRTVASVHAADSTLRLELDDGSERVVDHVVLGTGYRVDLSRYGFLDSALLPRVRMKGLSPKLSSAFESSVPGLYFVGAPAAASAGPGLRFVSHTGFAARAITRNVARR
jgi:hypothetical protein